MRERISLLYLVDHLDDPDRDTLAHLGRLVGGLDRALFEPSVLALHRIHAGFDRLAIPCALSAAGISSARPGWDLWGRVKLAHLISRRKYDLVCAYDLNARLLALPMARAANVGFCIAVVRDLGHTLTPGHVIALRKANEAAVRMVATSSAAASRLVRQERIRRDHVDVIPGGIDCTRFTPRTQHSVADAKHSFGLSVKQPLVYMEAPLERIKDHRTFLVAAAQLIRFHPHIRFVLHITGRTDAASTVQNLAQHAGILKHVIMIDDPSTRARWMQAADVAVLTSLSESCSDTLLAYMAAGLPIVATSVGGNAELIRHGECGYLFDPGEDDALAMRINILILAEDLATRFGEAAWERVRAEYSVESEIRRFSDYYRGLVFTSPGAGVEFYA